MALLAGMTIVACSNDDDKGGNSNCITCTAQGQSVEICKGDNGNAYIGNQDSGVSYDDYVEVLDMSADCK